MPRQIIRETTVVVKFDRQSDADEFRAGTDGLMRDLRVMGIRCDVDVSENTASGRSAAGQRAGGGR